MFEVRTLIALGSKSEKTKYTNAFLVHKIFIFLHNSYYELSVQ